MRRFQFTLSYLLIATVFASIAFFVVRFAFTSYGLAVILIAVSLSAVILFLCHIAIYLFLRAVGAIFGLETEGTEARLPAATRDPAAGM